MPDGGQQNWGITLQQAHMCVSSVCSYAAALIPSMSVTAFTQLMQASRAPGHYREQKWSACLIATAYVPIMLAAGQLHQGVIALQTKSYSGCVQ